MATQDERLGVWTEDDGVSVHLIPMLPEDHPRALDNWHALSGMCCQCRPRLMQVVPNPIWLHYVERRKWRSETGGLYPHVVGKR